MANGIKDAYLNQYQDIASKNLGSLNRQNLSYTDSPVFQKGFEAWNPTGLGSKVIENWSIPVQRGVAALGEKTGLWSTMTPEGGGLYALPTAAGFRKDIQDKIKSGTATPKEKQKFANVFGHEMSHLGWDYKPASERITIGDSLENLKSEGSKIGAKAGSISRDYTGEEQWNYLHDLMYNPRGYSSDKFHASAEALKNDLASGKINQEEFKKIGKELIKQHDENKGWEEMSPHVTNYLTDKGLINPGDLSYTPKAFDEIAWSGLTTPSKRAIGFGINPFEDTRAAGQFYRQQKYKKMSQAKKQAAMQETIRQAEAKKAAEAAAAKKAADAAAAKKAAAKKKYSGQGAQGGGGGSNIGGGQQTSRGIAGGRISHSAAKAARGNMSGWGLADGGLIRLFKYGGFI